MLPKSHPTSNAVPDAVWEELISAALAAPTPDNNQPWRFHCQNRQLTVSFDDERRLPSDVMGMFDLIGLGAALTNLRLTARSLGFDTQITLPRTSIDSSTRSNPDPSSSLGLPTALVKIIDGPISEADPDDFDPTTVKTAPIEPNNANSRANQPRLTRGDESLTSMIFHRHTNRHGYSKQQISVNRLDELRIQAELVESISSDDATPGSKLQTTWLTQRADISQMARLVARCDLMRFRYRPFHEELYRQLRFTKAQAELTRDGLDVRTLALPPGGRGLLQILRSWNVMRFLNTTQLSQLLGIPTRGTIRQSGAMGIISFPRTHNSEPKTSADSVERWHRDCIDSGSYLQKLWLAASRHCLAVQPLGSLALFFAREEQLDGAELGEHDRREINRTRSRFNKINPNLTDHSISMIFRIGHAPTAAHRSKRRPISDVWSRQEQL